MKKKRKRRGIEKVETKQVLVGQRKKNKRERKSYIGRLWGLRDGSKNKKTLNVVGLPSLHKHFPKPHPPPHPL